MEEKFWSEENQKKRKEKEKEEQNGDEEVDVVTALRVPKRLKRSNSRGHFELSLSNKVPLSPLFVSFSSPLNFFLGGGLHPRR